MFNIANVHALRMYTKGMETAEQPGKNVGKKKGYVKTPQRLCTYQIRFYWGIIYIPLKATCLRPYSFFGYGKTPNNPG